MINKLPICVCGKPFTTNPACYLCREAKESAKRGIEDSKAGRGRPWSEVKAELGLLNPDWARITTDESTLKFEPRDKGLRILLINAPIREWSYPNIMPIGQGTTEGTWGNESGFVRKGTRLKIDD